MMLQAALQAKLPPRRISFTGALDVVRARLGEAKGKKGRQLKKWYEKVVEEAAQERLPRRKTRNNPRVVKCPRQKWPAKRAARQQPAQPTGPFEAGVVIISTAPGELSATPGAALSGFPPGPASAPPSGPH